MNVLIVGGSTAVQPLLLAKLRSWGHTVTTASDGLDGWDQVRKVTYDLVIADWDLPQIAGPDLCRMIRGHSFAQYVYVILCAGRDQRLDLITGMEAGADDFISEPVDFPELRVRVVAAQRVMQLQSELAAQRQSLRRLNHELTEAHTKMERDLEAAAATQLRLLPTIYDLHPRVRLDWLFIPSRFLAGDLLNYYMADERHLVFYQLDVSGHGIAAALLSVTLSRILAPLEGSPSVRVSPIDRRLELAPPAEVVAELNTRFQGEDDLYFTIVYGILDVFARELRFCQAGHPGPVLMRRHAAPVVVGDGGFPVGMIPGMRYDETILQLEVGDRLIVHSNGLSECENAVSIRYEQQRLTEMLDQNRDGSLEALMNGVREALGTWRGQAEFADDVSVLALECV
ncbi:MAG TPA: fused response regulator/phosphatase [Bryobacteraceae bacterium]|jgi:sigma-B regulation protein RsbU (phosphoserine phosphatase)|nr:fused response regulator/phosphatase [Bryobacteraceae bacterium]